MDRAPTNVIAGHLLLRSSVLRCDVSLSLLSKICCKVSAREICAETMVSIFLCFSIPGNTKLVYEKALQYPKSTATLPVRQHISYFEGETRIKPRVIGSQLITTLPPSRLPRLSSSSRKPIICVLNSATAVSGAKRSSTSLSFP